MSVARSCCKRMVRVNARDVFVTRSCDSSHDALGADLSNGRPKKTSTARSLRELTRRTSPAKTVGICGRGALLCHNHGGLSLANLNGFLPALFPALALRRGHPQESLLQLDKQFSLTHVEWFRSVQGSCKQRWLAMPQT
jgi:hypothetical protein